ncbi:MAG: SAM-dependent methyltransferase, MidA [uncultured Microvirga sp.]|uniref:SAM-dependent methyltransferase, MidA n=1 Tax=uncultured Microvirga sp. TaxID=412392 RepID=A0A6J4LFJ6_9HYPH|nr:MAG: SAM-dependent methyltransferase, MidA [uncultured Microvirga sp.]
MTLLEELRGIIALEGPISVERYMELCLAHPAYGYYATRDPFGVRGDFTTAPEISQMFGEMIGLWAVEVWERLGSPRPLRLVEFGPGRGTLMADLLRAARVRPAFLEAVSVHLVETSPALRRAQRERLREVATPVEWHPRFGEVPGGPTIAVANEFLDALPVRQYVATERGWCERLVGLGPEGKLAFGLSGEPAALRRSGGRPGSLLEQAPARAAIVAELAARLAAQGGAALLIDYGYEGPALGDTLQAVRAHTFADPLAHPGDADLTAHVDFGALGAAALTAGGAVAGPVEQGAFLRALGIEARADRLKRDATPAQACAVEAAFGRLIGRDRDQMGQLFKVFAISHPGVLDLPGLPPLRSHREPDLPHGHRSS